MTPRGADGITRLLVANRGEVAVRIIRAAADLETATVAVFSEDDAAGLHVQMADQAEGLEGRGVAAYLDIDRIVAIAAQTGCDAVHPGYGFLAENAALARACEQAGLTFVGPTAEVLDLFGDKGKARAAAQEVDVPVAAGINQAVSETEASEFLASLGPNGAIMLKAVAGGGGRGSRVVSAGDDLAEAFARCQSEATTAFGNGDLFVEQLVSRARHIEVQVVADQYGRVVHLGERECSVQRRHQKIIEVAPAINLAPSVRAKMLAAAVRLAGHTGYSNIGTFEFLLDMDSGQFHFMEANARLQVEHTVTEAVTGIDLVQTQIRLADGASLADLGLDSDSDVESLVVPRGFAIQCRVNTETMEADGTVRPSGGLLTAYDPPAGPGVRVDGFGYAGYETSPSFDSLLAKVIVHAPSSDPAQAANRAIRALSEFRIEGPATNISFLQNVLARPEFAAGEINTRFVDQQAIDLVADHGRRSRFVAGTGSAGGPTQPGQAAAGPDRGLAGAQVDTSDPLALFAHDQAVKASQPADDPNQDLAPVGPDGSVGMPVPIQGTIVSVQVAEGEAVRPGSKLVVMEAMKMEHVITADRTGIVRAVGVAVGDVIREGFPIVFIEEADVEVADLDDGAEIDLDHIRDDLAELFERKAFTLDENRPEAVARRRKTGQFTVRENIDALCDPGSFREYGQLAVAAQRARRTPEWLRERSPADGLVGGLGTVNANLFGPEAARCMAISYDYTVFAGTQGHRNHYKKDRLFDIAERYRLPIVFFTEGGGGRPGDTDGDSIGMDVTTFTQFSQLSGLVPLVGLNSGRCFAGNTSILATCDVIIATKDSTVGMGGPAMIEGGGLGVYTPEEVGPMSMQVPNGVIDIVAEDDDDMVAIGKQYLSYFQGPLDDWEAPDQRYLRHVVPENRVQMYDVREVINTLADVGSVLEIRREFGVGIITSLVRIEGKPMGLIANNPHHLAGAIDSDGADKGARFLQLCDAFDLPVISIMDCPGIMVGPDAEREALVRHAARMFVTGANLQVPMFGLIIRKAYGLGVQAMCGGSSMAPVFSVAWPTAEFAGMNIEGAVKLGYRNDLAALETAEERKALFDKMTALAYERARAVNGAQFFGVDDVIDPAESRDWIVAGMRSLPPPEPRTAKRRPYIDTW